ncbi:NAD(P)H-binding protein [Actinosynnema sp. NPDC047251]|uniref:NmrA family protein n=1 Tax=Saccharothrix espanaensis (strain ATCC 51144 / DSM 44229 / JCM 9112 / NBRC 15066 / NRRL 15764) TaxID=1179773 RepID=K0JRF4_SACES|nr:NAD(P)H-binding protein [Saccharothrix espanaensis]CCH27927.1 NmrA family protein [Saccharothrix espanaensis DSM 44229]
MTTLITGATGHLGSLVVKHALDRLPAADLAVSVRDPARADLPVEVRHGDFAAPETLATAFAGVDKLLLVSADGPDEVRIGLHRAAVAAAVDAGVRHILYTSVSDADTSPLGLAKVHKATEELIRATGLAYTFLRNGMYHENYTRNLGHGPIVTAAGDGRIASASRDDLALAAAIALTTAGHENTVHEFTGPRAWTFDELAALAGTTHQRVTAQQRTAALEGFGLPAFVAELLTDIEVTIAGGALSEVRPDLEKVLGRPATPVEDAVRAALA